MKDSREDRSTRLAGSRAGPKTTRTALAAREDGKPCDPSISVRCPNPACGKTFALKSSLAGKYGRCPCGTVFLIPPAQAQPGEKVARRAADEMGAVLPREAVAPKGEDVTEVRVGCIGRGYAGKTALLRALAEGPVGEFFPSGLHIDAGDPRGVAQMIRDAEETQRLLHQFGLPPTLGASHIRYYLYDGARQRVAYQLREVIGQVLTHTLPGSAAEQQARYTEYLRSLVNTHVLWVVVPCPPPDPSARDRRRYANDLRITLAYLREALRLRAPEQPVAVALVLSKIDTLFPDADEARASLTDDVLRTSFGPLVHLIEQSSQVCDAVILPVTAFGFGNAILREEGGQREGAPLGAVDETFGPEPIWLLREGVSEQPYNLDTLLLWTLLHGLLGEAGPGVLDEDSTLGQLCRTLCEDLGAINPWLLLLKGGIVGAESLAAQMQSAR